MQVRLFILLVTTLALSSCSYFKRKNTVKTITPQGVEESVPKKQYDALLIRYQELNQKYNVLKSEKNEVEGEKLLHELKHDRTAKAKPKVAAKKTAPKKKQTSSKPVIEEDFSQVNVDKEVELYQKGVALFKENKLQTALKIFQSLEQSPLSQVKVRAKAQIGHILLAQNEYDMAMQMYEEIIENYAFSSVSLDAIRNLVVCTDKLKLDDKKNRYESILKDIFEIM